MAARRPRGPPLWRGTARSPAAGTQNPGSGDVLRPTPALPPLPPPLPRTHRPPASSLEAHFKLVTGPQLFRALHHVHLEPRPPLGVPLRRYDQDQSAVELDLELAQVGPHGRLAHALAPQPGDRSGLATAWITSQTRAREYVA